MKKISNNKIFTRRTKRHLAELALIFTSVFLAFILNEVRNNYNENKNLAISLEFIQEEITQNHVFIKETIEIHKTMVQIIDTLLENGTFETAYSEKSGFTQQNFYEGDSYFSQLLSHDAWNIANNNKIFDKMDIRDVANLSRAYEQQIHVMRTAWDIGDFLQSDAVFDKNRTKINCKILQKKFNLLIGLEIRLLKNYIAAEETLSKLID
ncbi:MAG: hypothetical protein JEY96_15545 [Bacteroidales bacterium]|nr:hypothetical protein [Bacteroidales bacterium]